MLDSNLLVYLIKHRPDALAFDATLVTNNPREFGRIDALRCENWAGWGARGLPTKRLRGTVLRG